ncbi:MAG: peptidase [Pseudomonadota bacterium]
MPTRTEIVAEARTWIGTPYVHQASCLGAGADCLGLLRGVWRALYGAEPAPVPAYTWDWSEPDGVERLMAAAVEHLVEERDARPGSVLIFRMRQSSVAKHIGILTDASPKRFIHAYTRAGVVEAALSEAWARRIAGVFAFPERR